ncbi:MAG: transporter [Sulfurimonas sp.]|nr:transporter [Sulfurimonas sp.]MBU3938182.1 TOBE domain-containing protein [bacterium]MBU4025017.1 TOBE domain-containing protein [bacterium]MBU4058315.1 TOBE domain-containing protein [bacterium]MBU4110493.1 TOBE domain-containing protein [bacterium]
MNKILTKVTAIESLDNLTVVSFESYQHEMRLMALGLNFPLSLGSEVLLGVKSSNISLAKDFQGDISISNQLQCTITAIEMGALLCSVTLRFANATLHSVITKASATKMQLQINDTIIALIKASNLSILEVIQESGGKEKCD